MRNLLRKKMVVATAMVASSLALSVASAFAGPLTTLANYKVNDPFLAGGNAFEFINAGTASTLSSIDDLRPNGGNSVLVDFSYTVAANTYNGAAGVNIPAELTLTSTVAGPAATAGGIDAQPMTDVLLTITALTPVNGKSNLFSVIVSLPGLPSDGLTYGHDGTNTATLKGDNGGNAGEHVTLSSDFLDLTGATREGYVLEFTNVTPGLSIAGNGFLSNFTALGAGQLEADAGNGQRIPEAATLTTLGLGAACLLLGRRRGTKV
jgi:hypothetical protein